MSSPSEQLNKASELVATVKELVEEIHQAIPEEFEDQQNRKLLEEFRLAVAEAERGLINPVLSIATIGTTSSGKSALVNGLIGQHLAPVESREMSAGVLHIEHKDYAVGLCDLIVEKTPGACWDTKSYVGITLDEAREFLDGRKDEQPGIFKTFRKAQEGNPSLQAPSITVRARILPHVWKEALGLPDGVGVRFVDLPGLKSIQDSNNLRVIQTELGRSCSIVVINFDDTDTEKRKILLRELRAVFDSVRGLRDATVFVVNRVDNRKSTDPEVPQIMEALAAEIGAELDIPNCRVIPTVALALFHLQCAWGASSPAGKPNSQQEERERQIRHFSQNCGGWLLGMDRLDDVVMLKQASGSGLEDETLRRLLREYGYESSGIAELLDTLKHRISSTFSNVVILPTLLRLFKSYEELRQSLNAISMVRRQRSTEDLEKARIEFDLEYTSLTSTLEQQKRELKAGIDELKEYLQQASKNSMTFRQGIENRLTAFGCAGIYGRVNQIRLQLIDEVLGPIHEGVRYRTDSNVISNRLVGSLPQSLAERVSVACANLTRSDCYTDDVARNGSKKLFDKGDTVPREFEKQLTELFLAVKGAMKHQAEFLLQQYAAELEDVLIDALERRRSALTEMSHYFREERFKRLEQLGERGKAKLPKDLLEEFDDVQVGTPKTVDIVVKKRVSKVRKRSCMPDKVVEEKFDEVKKVERVEVDLLSADQLLRIWETGMDEVENALWRSLSLWMESVFDEFLVEHRLSVDLLHITLTRTLGDHKERLRSDHARYLQTWDNVSGKLNMSTETLRVLSCL